MDAQYASMTPGLSEGPHIAIEVSDTGSGISPEVAERIFDHFLPPSGWERDRTSANPQCLAL